MDKLYQFKHTFEILTKPTNRGGARRSTVRYIVPEVYNARYVILNSSAPKSL